MIEDDLHLSVRLLREVEAKIARFSNRMVAGDATNPVSETDLAAEKAIREILKNERPEDSILGEEYGGKLAGGRTWLIDPIDGTINFIRDLPGWTSALALQDEGETVLSAIMKSNGEIYLAAKGKGIFQVKEQEALPLPLQPQETIKLKDSIVATCLDSRRAQHQEFRDGLLSLVEKSAALRAIGSGSFDFLSLVFGSLDGFVQYDMHPWDFVPGQLFVEESGGYTKKQDEWFIAARSKSLLEEISSLLAD